MFILQTKIHRSKLCWIQFFVGQVKYYIIHWRRLACLVPLVYPQTKAILAEINSAERRSK